MSAHGSAQHWRRGDVWADLTVRPGLRKDMIRPALQNPVMLQNLVAVLSLLVGLAGLTLSFAAHRQKVRQEGREAELRAEELAREREEAERRRQQERENEERRRRLEHTRRQQRERRQASLINVDVTRHASPLDASRIIPKAVIQNRSNRPVTDLRVSFHGSVVGESTLLDSAGEEAYTLPASESGRYGYLQHLTVDFTDVAGIRWRHEWGGALRKAQHGASGPEAWGPPTYPEVEEVLVPPAPAPDLGGAPPPPQRYPAPLPEAPAGGSEVPVSRRTRSLTPAVVLISLLLIAGSVWWFISH